MKTLILVRHAKSSWDNAEQTDFERPLNARGLADAPIMASRLKLHVPQIDSLISSTAVRALTTAELFAPAFGKQLKEIVLRPALYHASPEVLLQTVKAIPSNIEVAALFSHNPGISYFANSLSNFNMIDMPTCGVFVVQANIEHWQSFELGTNTHQAFLYPKQIQG